MNEILFTATTTCKVNMLILDRSFLIENDHKMLNLAESLNFGNELIKENGVPIIDYKVHPFNKNKNWKRRNTRKWQLQER